MRELERILIVALFFILLGAGFKAQADCTGCGDDGHQVCPIEKKHTHKTYMKEEHKESSSTPEDGIVSVSYTHLTLPTKQAV